MRLHVVSDFLLLSIYRVFRWHKSTLAFRLQKLQEQGQTPGQQKNGGVQQGSG
jgi:hypothetical protein